MPVTASQPRYGVSGRPCPGYEWIIQNKEVLTDRRYRLVHSTRASLERWSNGGKKGSNSIRIHWIDLCAPPVNCAHCSSHSGRAEPQFVFCVMGMVALPQTVNVSTCEARKSTAAHRTHSRNAELTYTASFWCQGKSKIM